MAEQLPVARVYSIGPAGRWFYQIDDEPPRGPFNGQLIAGKEARKEIIDRAAEKAEANDGGRDDARGMENR